MFFFLSKTLGVLLIPSNFAIALGALGLGLTLTRSRGAGYRLLAFCVAALLVCGYLPVGPLLLVPLEDRFPAWQAGDSDPTGIVVLGGGIDPILSAIRGTAALNASGARIVEAAKLARQYPHARLIYAGGSGALVQKNDREADAATAVLQDLGVARDRIEVDRQSRNTEENARFAKVLADPKPDQRWLLVTSAFHMPRAMGIFRKVGFTVEPYPVDFKTRGWIDAATLQSDYMAGLDLTNTALHEWMGLAVYRLTGKIDELFPSPSPASFPVTARVPTVPPLQEPSGRRLGKNS